MSKDFAHFTMKVEDIFITFYLCYYLKICYIYLVI